jgi:ABC-type sugar transport system permease subunit
VLGAGAGLRVSAEQLCKLSILVQLILSVVWTILPIAAGLATLATSLPFVTVGIHLFNIGAIYRAIIGGREYPWDVLKWTFLFATISSCGPLIGELARYVALLLDPGFWLFMMIPILAACLQVVVLWWPRTGEVAVGEVQP